jgi:hypothetical protein
MNLFTNHCFFPVIWRTKFPYILSNVRGEKWEWTVASVAVGLVIWIFFEHFWIAWFSDEPTAFSYTNQGGDKWKINGVDDACSMMETLNAMKSLQLPTVERFLKIWFNNFFLDWHFQSIMRHSVAWQCSFDRRRTAGWCRFLRKVEFVTKTISTF